MRKAICSIQYFLQVLAALPVGLSSGVIHFFPGRNLEIEVAHLLRKKIIVTSTGPHFTT